MSSLLGDDAANLVEELCLNVSGDASLLSLVPASEGVLEVVQTPVFDFSFLTEVKVHVPEFLLVLWMR